MVLSKFPEKLRKGSNGCLVIPLFDTGIMRTAKTFWEMSKLEWKNGRTWDKGFLPLMGSHWQERNSVRQAFLLSHSHVTPSFYP